MYAMRYICVKLIRCACVELKKCACDDVHIREADKVCICGAEEASRANESKEKETLGSVHFNACHGMEYDMIIYVW